MQNCTGTGKALLDACRLIGRTAPVVQALLARHFAGARTRPQPDEAGHVRVAQAAESADYLYGSDVARLRDLVDELAGALAGAGAQLARERPVLHHALDVARHPLDRRRRQGFATRLLPRPGPVQACDESIATCIWLRLWSLHAWVLELRLALNLTGFGAPADHEVLDALDRRLTALVQPAALWLSASVQGEAGPTLVLARAPAEARQVGNLLWPDRFGARLPYGIDWDGIAAFGGTLVGGAGGRQCLLLGRRQVEVPAQARRSSVMREAQPSARPRNLWYFPVAAEPAPGHLPVGV